MELVMVIIIVLLMMFYYSYFVFSVFMGIFVKWEVQVCEGSMVLWSVVFKCLYVVIFIVLVWGLVMVYYMLVLFVWLLFVLVGLLLVVLIICFMFSLSLGKVSFCSGIFVIYDELKECQVFKCVCLGMVNYCELVLVEVGVLFVLVLLEIYWVFMIIQDFKEKFVLWVLLQVVV